MELISINIGQERPIQDAKPSGKTGIYKMPVLGPVQITETGIPQDAIVDTRHHGGKDQAIYVYGELDYLWWSEQTGQPFPPGTFGDNLTVGELESGRVFIGDRFAIGPVILEVTAPRIPCVTLAARMGDPGFVKRFRAAERPGVYCRVIQAGWVEAGQAVRYLAGDGDRISLLEMFRDYYEPVQIEAQLRRYLAAPIAIRDRVEKQKQLQELLAKGV